MAPALTSQRNVHAYDAPPEPDKPPHLRRALASVHTNTLMDEDNMGLQNEPNLVKDQQEMEQILSDLGSTEIAPADLLQVIKTFDGGEGLSTGDNESLFRLTELSEIGESENVDMVTPIEKLKVAQKQLEQRALLLLKRVRILQAREIGKRVAEEVSQVFEKVTKGARKDGGGRPIGMKALIKKIDTTAALQASAASCNVAGPRYYRASTSKGDASSSASLGIPSGTLNELEDKASALRFHLSKVQRGLDSDATESSSGGESDDEAVTYNNPHQQHMPIEKRALWIWQKSRAKIAMRYSWLQAQQHEIEYKIRQQNDLWNKARDAKGAVEFEAEPAAYEGALPGDGEEEASSTCARVRPLRRETFKKRKLLQMHNLHLASSKAARPADIRCSCQYPVESCPICTGRADATQPLPPYSTLNAAQRIAIADPGYHPVLSDIRDVPPSVHLEALTSRAWFRSRVSNSKAWRGAHHSAAARPPPAQAAHAAHAAAAHAAPPAGKHPRRLKRGRPPLSRKIKERERDEDTSSSSHERARGRPSTESRAWRRQSYDIDNIVIPQSVAATTRPEILTYKEILTPKWRVMELPEAPMNNGVSKSNNRMSIDSEEEDISESAVRARHLRAEGRERSRYLRKQRSRRPPPDGEYELDAPLDVPLDAPLELNNMPHAPLAHVQPHTALPDHHETVRAYSPRQFPLAEDAYRAMLAAMPRGHRPPSPPPPAPLPADDEDSSTMSPASPLAFDGDDPDDAEWNPAAERSERRRSAFR